MNCDSLAPQPIPKQPPLRPAWLCLALLSSLIWPSLAVAQSSQVVPDNTLGIESSQVVLDGVNDRIEGGASRGNGLFHSLQKLDVEANRGVYFASPTGITQIFTRITGGQPSQILGTLGVLGNADLFLLNPSGIMFGANASLDLTGSFIASTANSLQFANNVEFSTVNPQPVPVLTVTVPIGLGFGSNPAGISVQGAGQPISFEPRQLLPDQDANLPAAQSAWTALQSSLQSRPANLQVTPGKTLLLVGGGITLTGANLVAPGGQIVVGSVSSAGVLGLSPDFQLQPAMGVNAPVPGSLQLLQRAGVNASGNGGGLVQFWGDRISLQDQSAVTATTLGDQPGRGISIQANHLELTNQSLLATNSLGSGSSGTLLIQTDRLTGQGRSLISTVTLGSGRAGDLTVQAIGDVHLSGESWLTTSPIDSLGAGGNLLINANNMTVQSGSGAITSSYGPAPAGRLAVNINNSLKILGTSTDGIAVSALSGRSLGSGNAASVEIRSQNLSVQDGAQVSGSTLGLGRGGSLTVEANSIHLQGMDARGNPSVLLVETRGGAPAGDLTINTGTLTIGGGAQVSASTRGGGQGGQVRVNARERIDMTGLNRLEFILDGLFVGTIASPEELGSGIFALSFGAGNAGDMTITTPEMILRDGAFVSTAPFQDGKGGNLTVKVSGAIQLQGSQFFADSFGDGDSGIIDVQARRIVITDGGAIAASAFQDGQGGTIRVQADDIELIGLFVSSNQIPFKSGIFANAYFVATRQAGNLEISGKRLLLKDGAGLGAATFNTAKGGTITVNMSESVEVVGISSNGKEPSNIVTQSTSMADAGNLQINTRRLSVRDGGAISTATAQNGRGGTLTIQATELLEVIGSLPTSFANATALPFSRPERGTNLISNLRTDTLGSGPAGDLNIQTDRLRLVDGAAIAVRSTGTGPSGNLTIQANFVELTDQAAFLATTASGEGGNIQLSSGDLWLRRNSQISAEAAGTGNGGNININTDVLIALERSAITANAFEGMGGNILINTQGLFLSSNSLITASSERGINGVVQVQTLGDRVQNNLTQLSDTFVNPDQVISNSCLASRNAQQGSFVVTGTGGLPQSPYDDRTPGRFAISTIQPLPERSNAAQNSPSLHSTQPHSSPTMMDQTAASWKLGDPIQEAKGLLVTPDGQVVLGTAEDLQALASANELMCHQQISHQ